MKHVVTYILKEGEGENFVFSLAISKSQQPEVVINRLIALRNRTLLKGEEAISLVRIRAKSTLISYKHDWEKIGKKYVCRDCGIVGKRETPFSKIKVESSDIKFKDCSWKIKVGTK